MNIDKFEKYLPLGSVVIFKGCGRPVMIIGYLPKTGDKCMDYIATIYPEGIINENIIMGVNHKDIMLVITPGYCNKQFEKYNKDLIKIGEQYENAQ